MLYNFDIEGGVLRERAEQASDVTALESARWIDLVAPDEQELALLNSMHGGWLPDIEDVEEIEASARFFVDEQGIHVHSLFLYQSEGRHRTTTVAFVLSSDQLVTVRDNEIADFRLMRMRARRGWVKVDDPFDILLRVLEQKVENMADNLENIHRQLENVSQMVLEDETSQMEEAIDRLAKLEDNNGKTRLCLMDTQRSISFLQRHLRNDVERRATCLEMQHDLETLMTHTNFLFEKINFLMDTAQGFINIEQSQIIKTFSIAAVVFLPPTMVASVYGMNFRLMPELDWALGYPFALLLMFLSGLAPFLYFKYKGWL
ncbi:magnesium/cobalt transporter CorA [Alcanivorax quisquiliarum]|uniref:Magnesium transport protein CorA n=1 Tax=Alcanivorax quisquiliarum TaxID=2933565 RepID=A0ABT0E3R9_9GAMM|nr:magnesium/cobalt transporter CorA [Alcanivorax quisquiliarum]MCK0536339.1 magnesium/cobalt transporter CorA [Alcanivorax quisquiliarum]